MSKPPNRSPYAVALRMAVSAALVAMAFLLRQALLRFGIELPPFLTLFPTLVVIALFGGLLSGLLSTILAAALVDYFIFPPIGQFAVASPSEAISLALFFATGVLLSAIVERHRKGMQRLADFEGRQRLMVTEAQLRQTAEYRSLALEAAGLGGWELNREAREILWDLCCSHAFGFNSEQHVSYDRVLDRIHPQDRDAVRLAVERAIAGEEAGAFHCEFRVVWPDESIHWIASHGRVTFEGPRAVRLAGVNGDITDRKLVEERLLAGEARYRNLVEAIPAMLWAADAHGQRTNQNRRWCEYTGQTHEEVLGGGWRDVIFPEDLPRVLDCWHRSERTGEDYSLEYRIRRADGVYRWHRVHARLQRDAEGHPVGWFGTSIDIEDQKCAEARLRRFYDSGLFAILYWKIDGGVLDVTDRFLEFTGYTREDVAAGLVNWAEITPPEFRALDEEARRQIRETGVHQPYEKQFLRKDGSRVWGQFWAAAYDDDRTRGVSLILDISERKRAEESLRESERQFRTLADAMPQLCWMAHADGWLFWYNRRWYEYTGTTPEQMEGWGWQSVHDPSQLAAVTERWKQSIATGTPFDMVFPLRGADGVFRPFLTRVMPIYDAEGRVVRWFGTNTDIGEQKRIEAELRKSREQLDLALGVAKLGEWDRDLCGGRATRSLRHAQIFGYTSADEEWNFDKFLGHILPPYRAEVAKRLNTAQSLGTIEFEAPIRRLDGQIRWLWIRSSTLPDDSGKPARASGVVMDITERKQVEESLRQQAELLDLAHDTIMVCDLDGTVRFWNHGAVEKMRPAPTGAARRFPAESLCLYPSCLPRPMHGLSRRSLSISALLRKQWPAGVHPSVRESGQHRQGPCFVPLDNRQEKWEPVVEYRGESMPTPTDLLQGTLDLLILQTLALEPMHGWGIAQRIEQVSREVLQIGQGSLYPALYRLEYRGWIKAEWGNSENNRRAKFYRLTAAGRTQLEAERASWDRLSGAIALVLGKTAEVSS